MKCPKYNSNLNINIDEKNDILKCDYEIVTTYITPIELDETLHKLTVLVSDDTINQVKVLSKSLVFIFLGSNKILIKGNYTY